MKIYIAAHDPRLAEAFAAENSDHEFTSRWHKKPFYPTDHHTLDERFEIAIEDFNDIKRAEALVLISGPGKYPGGKFVEAGIAYGLGMPVYFVGRRENMLTYLFEPWASTPARKESADAR